MSYVYEDGKTFWEQPSGILERCHDVNFNGARFKHKRCPFCNRITSIATLHWFNHILKCQPIKYHPDTILRLRHDKLIDIPDYMKKDSSYHPIYNKD